MNQKVETRIIRQRSRELSRRSHMMMAERNLNLGKQCKALELQLVPVSSGDLKSTIRLVQEKSSGAAIVIAGGIARSGREVDYAPDVEFGTSDSSAQPFATPAMQAVIRRARNQSFIK